MNRVVLMCGPAGSGKSTVARRLEAEGMTRLSFDHEAWRQGIRTMPLSPALSREIEQELQARLLSLVGDGVDVVSFWSRRMRMEYRDLLRPLAIVPETIYLATARTVAIARIATRRHGHSDDYSLPEALAAAYFDHFEPPAPMKAPCASSSTRASSDLLPVALPRVTMARIIAVVIDDALAQSTARTIADAALGHGAGPLDRVDSKSHHVYVGGEAVVKLIAADDHARLDREITLGVDLPAGITAPVLAHGRIATQGGDVRYACMARQPGASPGTELVGVDRDTALRWSRQAAQRLQRLHDWSPGPAASAVLNEKLDHGGFVTRAQYVDLIEQVGEASTVLSQAAMDGLRDIADRAPERAGMTVPVHADCHWGNWLIHDDQVTVLLDCEWARFGEPVDDWMFLSRFSGSHMQAVLALVAELTKTSLDSIRAACELRESSYLASDLLIAVSSGDHEEAQNLGLLLERIIGERQWWDS